MIILVFNDLEVKITREGQGPQSGQDTVPGRATVLKGKGPGRPPGGKLPVIVGVDSNCFVDVDKLRLYE